MRSFLLALAFLLVPPCVSDASAASPRLSERSPVRMGLWWDPQHSGSGFELFQGGDQVAVIWYTYREDRSPVWYSAIARFDADGRWEAPLYRHRWAQGAHATPLEVGRLVMQRQHFDGLALRWRLDAREGEQSLQPFPLAGIVPEIDHSGAWYERARSGYGLSLTEQGEWLGAALYFYDAAGEPTWVVGNNEGHGSELQMQSLSGNCPGCTRLAGAQTGSATLNLSLQGETRLHASYRGSGSTAWTIDAGLEQLSTPASLRPADRSLAAFDDGETLRGYLVSTLLRDAQSLPAPVVDFSPQPATESFSSTNLQESGVDEADAVKSDGRWIHAIGSPAPQSTDRVLRTAQVVDDGVALGVRADIALPGSETPLGYSGLYLTGDRLLTLGATRPQAYASEPLWLRIPSWRGGMTQLASFDRVDPATPALRWTAEIDAHLVASRRIGNRLVLVLRKSVSLDGVEPGAASSADIEARNRALLDAATLDDLLPRIRFDGGDWRALLAPQDVHLPVFGAQEPTVDLMVVASLDLEQPEQVDALAVAGSVYAVYVSSENLYLATMRSGTRFSSGNASWPDAFYLTDVHRVALGPGAPHLDASGTVEGYLDRDPDRAPFRFSERAGKLRLVTVANGMWGDRGQNRLTVLEPSTLTPGLLRTVSYLPNRERPAPLGKPDEQLYGTRYVDDRLYAVTFLSTDPLYVIDLADPAAPRIAGEVELPGFSEYLHPVGDDLLLGVGLDAVPVQSSWGDGQFAWYQGLLFSLFDVSNPASPRVLQQRVLGKRGSGSALLHDHHALSVLRGDGQTSFALPVRVAAANGSEPVNPPPNHTYAWSWSGMQKLRVVGSGANAQLIEGPALVTRRPTPSDPYGVGDDAEHGARAVQFLRGTAYVDSLRFWLVDANGARISGPQ